MENGEEIKYQLDEITELNVEALTGFKLLVEIPKNLKGTMTLKKGKTHTGGLVKLTTGDKTHTD